MMATLSPRARVLVMTLLLLAFLAGGAAGVVAARTLGPRPAIKTSFDMAPVLDELDLTQEQRRQAEAILERNAPRSSAVMMELAERLRAVADSVDLELRAILTPEQRERLDAMRRDRRMMLKRKVVTPGGTRVDTIIDTSGTR
jgi:Spy/CpxP family protein refolding chaperone